jgi:tight adherence protein B
VKFGAPVILVGVGAILLVAVAAVLLIVDATRKAKQARINSLLKVYTPSNKGGGEQQNIRAVQRDTSITSADSANAVIKFFGVRADQVDLYPAPWWALLLGMGAIGTIAGGLLSAVFGYYGWAAQPLTWLLGSRFLFGAISARRARILYTQMPDALAMIVRSVRTGLPVAEALRIVGKEAQQPTAIEFERLFNQLMIGAALPDALISMARRTEVPEYRFFAVALSLQGQTGGSLTDTLENLADVIRKRTAMRARAYALSSEARTTVMVLASLPFVAFVALLFMAPQYATLLLDTNQGREILAAAILSLLLGLGMMQLMIRRALS